MINFQRVATFINSLFEFAAILRVSFAVFLTTMCGVKR